MIYLTVKDAANLEEITKQGMGKRITAGKVMAREIKSNVGRGGISYEVALPSLSAPAQARYWAQQVKSEPETAPRLSDAALADEQALQDELRELTLVRKAQNCPDGVRVADWVAAVAAEMSISPRTLYRKIENLKTFGALEKPRKGRADKGNMRSWDGGAEDIFRSLALEKENRHATVLALYNKTCRLAAEHGLAVGSLRTAYRIYDDMGAAAHIYRKHGVRGLDVHVLPPILRNYNDLQVNDIWVGDQHTFNWFVVDEFSGDIFRLQGYVWQDLRSRAAMGLSLAKQYDAWSIGLALRDGIMSKIDRIPFGKPRCVYNDWGKPERAKYLAKLAACGVEAREMDEDFEQFISPFVADTETGVYDELSIQRRSAKVRNSKAKMIERFFGSLEQMLADRGLKGYAGNKSGSLTDADKQDLKMWRARGELMTAREFAQVLRDTLVDYNARPHRGYGMMGMSPNEVFETALAKGYKPIVLDKSQADMTFMKSAKRRVMPAGVNIDGEWWHNYSDEMVQLVKQFVEVRWVPFDDVVHIFHKGEYVCAAPAYERGSMVDEELTARLNERQKKLGKNIKKELAAMGAASEDYNTKFEEEKVRKAVTRFDHAARKSKNKPKPAPVVNKKNDPDLWKLLAENDMAVVFDRN